VNLSDIAAMGGVAGDAYVCLALPDDLTVEYVEEMYRGMKGTAAAFSVNVLGGDTTGSKADLVISVTVTGEVERAAVLYRSGARPGDRIYLSGPVGDSGAGLDALLTRRGGGEVDELVRRHLEPIPHLVQGRVIAASRLGHAMIDVSDGVAIDLSHICEESGVGAIVHEDTLPISPELAAYSRHFGLDPTSFALGGGEDYVLLLTGEDSLGSVAATAGVRLFEIGRIIEEPRMLLRRADGSASPLEPRGWDHFKKTDPLR
jgi:thiamine-monophosphate kinase